MDNTTTRIATSLENLKTLVSSAADDQVFASRFVASDVVQMKDQLNEQQKKLENDIEENQTKIDKQLEELNTELVEAIEEAKLEAINSSRCCTIS